MNLEEFRKLTEHLPGHTELFIINDSCEWYGIESITEDSITIDTDKNSLCIDFCLTK